MQLTPTWLSLARLCTALEIFQSGWNALMSGWWSSRGDRSGLVGWSLLLGSWAGGEDGDGLSPRSQKQQTPQARATLHRPFRHSRTRRLPVSSRPPLPPLDCSPIFHAMCLIRLIAKMLQKGSSAQGYEWGIAVKRSASAQKGEAMCSQTEREDCLQIRNVIALKGQPS